MTQIVKEYTENGKRSPNCKIIGDVEREERMNSLKTDILTVLEQFKNKKCQWYVFNGESVTNFIGEAKQLCVDHLLGETLHIDFKGPGKMKVRIKGSLTYKEEKNQKFVRYSFYSKDEIRLMVGYLKETKSVQPAYTRKSNPASGIVENYSKFPKRQLEMEKQLIKKAIRANENMEYSKQISVKKPWEISDI